MPDVLSRRALNRATLARQLLLERRDRAPAEAVHHLVGLQAQEPPDPYVALWARLRPFDPHVLGALLVDRLVVRTVLMRGTIHLVTAEDCLALRRLFQPVLDRELAARKDLAPGLDGVDLEPVLRAARRILREPRSTTELRTALAERFPERDAAALAYACRNHLTLVQAPPRAVWGGRGQVRLVTAESWLGASVDPRPSLDDLVLRYLGAFGPATPGDVTSWSGLQAMRAVVDRLRPRLRTFTDERGRELFDLPDAPRPDPDTPAPVRFLPEFDNVLLAHADRRRFTTGDDFRQVLRDDQRVRGTVLVDGQVGAVWWRGRDHRGPGRHPDDSLVVEPRGRLAKRARDRVAAEGRRLLRFLEPSVGDPDVRVIDPF